MTVWMTVLLLKGLLRSLVVTELLELLAAACYPHHRNRHDFLLVFLVNVLTNPLAVYLDFLLRYQMPSVVLWICLLEFAVWLTEACVYRKCLTGGHNPYLFSLLLNTASYFGGTLLNRIL
jgi:hypothetical protein